jgi:hypothetical protein
MQEGRLATADRRYGDAVAAFTAALVTVPFDGPAHAELGYASLLLGNTKEAIEDLTVAALVGDEATQTAAYFNLGLAYGDLQVPDGGVEIVWRFDVGDTAAAKELSRAYFAVAARRGSKAATSRLAGRSRCPAARIFTHIEPVVVASGWRDLARQQPGMVVGSPDAGLETEEKARRAVCAELEVARADSERKGDACGDLQVGKEVSVLTGHQAFHNFETLLLPLPGGALAAESVMGNGWSCRGGTGEIHLSLADGVIVEAEDWVTSFASNLTWEECFGRPDGEPTTTPGCPVMTHTGAASPCMCVEEVVHEVTYHDARTGRGLLRLILLDGPVSARFHGNEVTIVGDGCGETLPRSGT